VPDDSTHPRAGTELTHPERVGHLAYEVIYVLTNLGLLITGVFS